MYWTGSKWLNNVQSQIYFGTMNFCCLQLYCCCDICYIWKLFIVRYRYGCIHCRELGMKIMKIGTLKYYLADEGDLLTLLEHPGHPADPSEDDPRHALPHGAQPLQVVQGDHQGHARCDLHWLTVQLSTAHILRAVLRPGPGQQLVFRAVTGGGICRSEATWQPPPRLTSHSEQISRYCQWWRRGHDTTSIVWRLCCGQSHCS